MFSNDKSSFKYPDFDSPFMPNATQFNTLKLSGTCTISYMNPAGSYVELLGGKKHV